MPHRSIFDQVRLTKMMLSYAEAMEMNGAIAYDYLWRTLEAFQIPDRFIQTVRLLYDHANTIVIINGERSTPFAVTRGVRQRDPLLCLLFNLAIEPLVCMLCKSTLTGFHIPGVADKLIVSMFADDTTAYLACHDSLDKRCLASRLRKPR